MYLELKHESTRTLQLTRAWSLQNKTRNFEFSFSATLEETVQITGARGIKVSYALNDFQSENLTAPTMDGLFLEFVLTDAGAISSGDSPTGHLADIAEDIRCAWITPELGVQGLCWTTEPGIHSKLEKPMRQFEAGVEHRITQVREQELIIESVADISLKLEPAIRLGPLHGRARQVTTLHRHGGPTEMKREAKIMLHDPNQGKPVPIDVLSMLKVIEN